MSDYSWQTNVWPIPAHAEIKASHFEDLRKFIYLRRFPGAGKKNYNYSEPLRNTTWDDYVDDCFGGVSPWPGLGMTYRDSHWTNSLLNVVFRSSADEAADLYSCYTDHSFGTIQAIKDNPPVFANGTMNSSIWCYAVDIDRYHDFDRWSGRKLVKTYTKGSLDTYLSACDGWRYLPIQVGSEYQRKNIKYTNTGRIITSIPPVNRSLKRYDLSQPSTMGPNYDMSCTYDPAGAGSYLIQKEPLSGADDCDSLGYLGWQEAMPMPDADPPQNGSGAPSDAVPNEWVDENQHAADPKFCNAYQNQVEQLLNGMQFMQKINVGTAWGAEFKRNYDQLNYHWLTGAIFNGYFTYKRVDAQIWTCSGDHRGDTPSYETGWSRIDYGYALKETEPQYASMQDERWGCNCSSVELALWITGNYDRYYCQQHIFTPQDLLKKRCYAAYDPPDPVPDPPGDFDAWLNLLYPLSEGTWRRTHKYTFGRPKGVTCMMPSSVEPTAYTYNDYQDENGDALWFCGSFVPDGHSPDDESDYLTNEQIADLKSRHNPVFNDTETSGGILRYEQSRQMLNHLWELLEVVDLIYYDVACGMEMRTARGQVNGPYANANAAYQAAIAAAETAITSVQFTEISIGLIGGEFSVAATHQGGGIYNWAGDGYRNETNFVIDASSLPDDIESINVFCQVTPYVEIDWPEESSETSGLTVLMDDISTIPNFDAQDFNSWEYPDDYPEGWLDWGGKYVWESGPILSGVVMAVTLELGTPAEDGKYHIPIPFTDSYPASISGYTPSGGNYYVRIVSYAYLQPSQYQIGIAVKRNMDNVAGLFSSKSYRTFTTIATDDGLFGSDGYPA